MKKRKIQRWIKRVSYRVGAFLSTCLILATMVVPAFASNNASTQKWYVADESNLYAESGVSARYLKLTPYVGGQEFTYTSMTGYSSYSVVIPAENGLRAVAQYSMAIPFNYPDWWRSALPIGNYTYVDFRLVSCETASNIYGPWSSDSSPLLYFWDSANAVNMSWSASMGNNSTPSDYPASFGDGASFSFASSIPLFFLSGVTQLQQSGQPTTITASSVPVSVGSDVKKLLISGLNGLTVGPWVSSSSSPTYAPLLTYAPLTNLSTDRFVIGFVPQLPSIGMYCRATFKLSFWVAADKLPAGLQVGDEFPANNDAFDNMRDELIEQFPEISENVKNGKDTINGWNDTETVGEDVASSSLSVINGLFQNLGQFLAIVSLMIFGAVCVRMLIKKAVSG